MIGREGTIARKIWEVLSAKKEVEVKELAKLVGANRPNLLGVIRKIKYKDGVKKRVVVSRYDYDEEMTVNGVYYSYTSKPEVERVFKKDVPGLRYSDRKTDAERIEEIKELFAEHGSMSERDIQAHGVGCSTLRRLIEENRADVNAEKEGFFVGMMEYRGNQQRKHRTRLWAWGCMPDSTQVFCAYENGSAKVEEEEDDIGALETIGSMGQKTKNLEAIKRMWS